MQRAAFQHEQEKDEDEQRTAAAAHSNRAADSAVAAAVPSAGSSSSASGTRRPRPPIASAQSPLIVIAGCGIGGSALALALQQRGMRVLVVERDPSCAARSQGYGLTMQQGGAALQALGVTVSGVASVQHRSFDTTGRLIGCYGRESRGETAPGRSAGKRDSASAAVGNAAGRHNLHLPRQRLRAAIIEQLLPDTVRWGVSVKSFQEDDADHSQPSQSEPQSQRGVTVHLSDGSVVRCALLVGADGIRSVIRAHKFGPRAAPLQYLGLIVVLGYARTCDPSLRRRVTQTCDGCTRIYTMPFDGPHLEEGAAPAAHTTTAASSSSSSSSSTAAAGATDGGPSDRDPGSDVDTTMWQLSFPMAEADALELAARGPAALKAEAMRRCALWHAPIPQLLESTSLDCITGYPAWDRDLPALDLLRNGAAAETAESASGSSASTSASASASAAATPAPAPAEVRDRFTSPEYLQSAAAAGEIFDRIANERQGCVGMGFSLPAVVSRSTDTDEPVNAYTGMTESEFMARFFPDGLPSSDGDLPASVAPTGVPNVAPASEVGDARAPRPAAAAAAAGSCRCSRVTMLGDAVHPMSPFKGQGANQSLLDAVALARALANCDWTCCCDDRRAAAADQPATVASAAAAVAAPTSLCTALRTFEAAMLARVRGKVLESRANAAFLHSPAVLHEGNCSRASVAKAAAHKQAQMQEGNDGVTAGAHTEA